MHVKAGAKRFLQIQLTDYIEFRSKRNKLHFAKEEYPFPTYPPAKESRQSNKDMKKTHFLD